MKLPNPPVTTPDGAHALLWTLLPDAFAILGARQDPLAAVDAAEIPFWESLATAYLAIAAPEPPLPQLPPGVLRVVDSSGELLTWCSAQGGNWVVVRPDRHVFGVYTADNAQVAAADLRAALKGESPVGHLDKPGRSRAGPALILFGAAVGILSYVVGRRRRSAKRHG